ncbi:MAG: hypothetical protein IAI49_09705 [Candidatus Eremiobacteraeota bacterium]|nr:hypothetical protein [Candidatus Eremiobacteraeota bacterium]
MTPISGAAEGAAVAAPPALAPIPDGARLPLDETAESVPDSAATLAEAFSQRAEVLLLATQGHQQALQARLDRMRADFNAAQEERSERLREMNMLRDMAMEQAKHDDEILKKFIAMI